MKKLLILGATHGEVNVAKFAKQLGYYVIVTDNHEDWIESPAKYIADEAWNLSWSDIPELSIICREHGVSGVLAGFSEFRVENMIKLSKELGLPCYINMEQLEITRDKDKFKKLCRNYQVPTVKEYQPDYTDISFPVIIKPTDRAGSIGINVAYNRDEYDKFLDLAYSLSPSKSVIVEDFIGDGVKFDCTYVVFKHQAFLVETCDTTMLSKEKGDETLQKAWTFPSKHEKEYVEKVDKNVKEMLNSLGMEYGVANISFFYRNHEFYVFETGFRLGGGHSYDYQRATGGIDYLEMLIKYSMNEQLSLSTFIAKDRGYGVTYNIYMKGEEGEIIQKINDEESVKIIEGVVTYIKYLYKGKRIESTKPIKVAMMTICEKSLESLIRSISLINETFSIETDKKVHCIYGKLEKNELYNSFNE